MKSNNDTTPLQAPREAARPPGAPDAPFLMPPAWPTAWSVCAAVAETDHTQAHSAVPSVAAALALAPGALPISDVWEQQEPRQPGRTLDAAGSIRSNRGIGVLSRLLRGQTVWEVDFILKL